MKSKQIILMAVLISIMLGSCKNDDDSTDTANGLQGTWNLSNVNGGLIGINIEYSKNEVIWTFNENIGTLTVTNNIMTTGPEQIYSGPETGTYSYDIVLEDESEIIYIDGQERGVLTIEANTFYIDAGLATDGFLSKYIR